MFKKENLRRNFLRVKQNIDQNLGRAEKSEVLSEDQQENEKRVDVVKHAFQNISKKAGVILQTAGLEYDKRLKKLPETNLGHSMLESAQTLGQETLLGSVCQLCGDCQINLAKEHVQYEMTVEQDFVAPLQNVVDVDIPSIIKLRKNLNRSTLDMDSAKSRFNQAVRQSHVPGANMANAAAKADVIREEFEDASQKVENIKDNLSIELCNFAAKESEHSNRLLLLLEAQAEFHRKALEAIEACIPQMKEAIQNSPAKPCYGMPLEEHLRLMCRDIALVLEACILTLLEMGMEEEGLFRIAGAAIKLKKLKASFDANAVDMEEFSSDPHTVAGALKQYLRELPEPLLTYALYDEFMQAASLPQDQRLQTLWTVINKLPKANYNNFRYLIKFLAKLAEKSDVNKMKPSNIAIVIGPNLMWTEKSNAPNMLTTGTVSAITEAVVTHADWFFPGELDFTNVGYHYDEDQLGGGPHTPVNSLSQPHINNTEALHVQVTPSQGMAQFSSPGVSPVASTNPSSSNLPVPSESPTVTSPVQRRATRKPAPPPPPERPFNVVVTATSTTKAVSNSSSPGGIVSVPGSGWAGDATTSQGQQNKSAPLASPELSSESHPAAAFPDRDRHRMSFHGDRPSVPPPDKPDRPRLPPLLNPPPVAIKGHQRSSSTGAVMHQPVGSPESFAGVPNADGKRFF